MKQRNFFTCGHRGFGLWCHRCFPYRKNYMGGMVTAPQPDSTRHVKGHGRPRQGGANAKASS